MRFLPNPIDSARDLPSHVATPVILRPSCYVGPYDTMPEPGDRWPYGDWDESTTADATHFLVRYASFSDYSGSTCERSNYEALLQDYPESFVDVFGGHGTRALLLPAECDDVDLIQHVDALGEYPLYDESHHSELEHRLAEESWDAYVKYDLTRALSESGADDDVVDDIDDDVLRELFWDGVSESGAYFYCEDAAGSVVYPDWDNIVSDIVDAIEALSVPVSPVPFQVERLF